ncbi:MAG: M23 family metallopeptidase [Patescibacteria group bacterium]
MQKQSDINVVTKKVAQFLYQLLRFITIQLTALLLSLPYLGCNLVMGKRKIRKGNILSRIFRKILEFKKAKQVIGINLASLLVVFSVVQVPNVSLETSGVEDSHLKTETIITTESSFGVPVAGYVSQGYSWYHPGIDIAGNENAVISPIAPGRVVQIEYSRFGYGINVMVDHGDSMLSRYAHMKKVAVSLNQEVGKDTVLGYVGSTGWSTGPHLHLEVYQSDRTINPLTVFNKDYAKVTYTIPAPINTNVVLASAQMGKGLEDVPIATTTAQISFKEVAEGFEEPFAYQNIATPSSQVATVSAAVQSQ